MKKITTPWTVALIVSCLIGFTFTRLFWRIIGSTIESVGRFLGEFVGLRPTTHFTITPGDVVALKYGFWLVFIVLCSNWIMRWWLESNATVREFGKKMYRWVSKPLLFCLIFGILAPYLLDLVVGFVSWIVYFCTGKMSDSWRVVVPRLEHKYHFTFDGMWEMFWLWLDGPASAATHHFGSELRRQL